MGGFMIEFDNFSEIRKPIDIQNLLLQIKLPIRLKNILKSNIFYSEESFFQTVDKLLLEHTSYYLFPNKLISFYPQMMERHATKDLTCNLSGAKIKAGNIYYTYHPFMEDLESGRVYTIKRKIQAELGFIDLFPQDLFTYEEWYYKLATSYYQKDDIIDFYFLSRECGESCLEPYLLGLSKNKRKK